MFIISCENTRLLYRLMDFGLILEAIMKVSLSQAKDRTSFFALNSALP